MKSGCKSILLVNPWIHDFAAYDLWLKPLGLLYIGAILRSRGYAVSLLDCLDFLSLPTEVKSGLKSPVRKVFGQGHFYKEVIPKPEALQEVPRQYRRYGIPPQNLAKVIQTMPAPDLILMTSSMTYWYPGIIEAIGFLRKNFGSVPILLGGTYATLCPDHARRYSGADRVLPGPWDGEKMRVVAEILGEKSEESFASWPYPAFDLYGQPPYVCLLTRRGCPFSCTYCASSRLARGFESRPPHDVVEEILYWNERGGVKNFAFYDDALLIDSPSHILPILRELIQKKADLNFHTPNALHVRALDREVAEALFRAGFKTIRLGLETAQENLQKETGGKATNREFQEAVVNLRRAGYSADEIGVYLLVGLPRQRAKEVSESIQFVKEAGAKPILVEYSPIPGTPLFEEARRASPFDLENEPLFHNNSLLPCRGEGLTWSDYRKLKEEARNL